MRTTPILPKEKSVKTFVFADPKCSNCLYNVFHIFLLLGPVLTNNDLYLWILFYICVLSFLTIFTALDFHPHCSDLNNTVLSPVNQRFYYIWQWAMWTWCIVIYITNASRGTKRETKERRYNWLRGKTWWRPWQSEDKELEEQYLDQCWLKRKCLGPALTFTSILKARCHCMQIGRRRVKHC